ncbi:MAG: DUF2202 domain-containing protein [Sedimentisphaerales bacterium]|nr:DUF2202 domain-containing protein [Sedimentisphaerales bacterium]
MKATHLLASLAITGVLAGTVAAAGRNAHRGQGPCTQPAATQLSEAEIADVLFMREEEKLARDVYLALAELWDCPIFTNIAVAEQRHMDALGLLIVKHDLDDSIVDDTRGVFATPEFANLYAAYIETGSASLLDALSVGLEIEELDIEDLEQALETVQASDVQWVFENLLRGSYNHLRAFSRAVATGGESCDLQDRAGRRRGPDGQAGGSACRGRGCRGGNGRGRANGNANGNCDGSGQADRQRSKDGTCQAAPEDEQK